jgi:hypothetical protein
MNNICGNLKDNDFEFDDEHSILVIKFFKKNKELNNITFESLISDLNIFKKKQYKFVIHIHHARTTHFDLRIQSKTDDTKLESFACKKIDELISDKTKKILLIRQPLHEMEWFFTGNKTIGSGYGKGKVETFDSGTFNIIKWTDENKTDSNGNNTTINVIILEFNGRIIKGKYTILRYFGSDNDTHYLMFKNIIKL